MRWVSAQSTEEEEVVATIRKLGYSASRCHYSSVVTVHTLQIIVSLSQNSSQTASANPCEAHRHEVPACMHHRKILAVRHQDAAADVAAPVVVAAALRSASGTPEVAIAVICSCEVPPPDSAAATRP